MKSILVCVALAGACAHAVASGSDTLERALGCQMAARELPSLMADLSGSLTAFVRPVAQYGAPTANVYLMPVPVSAHGYTSPLVVVMPGRVLLAVDGRKVRDAVATLKLHASAFSPASRQVQPTVSIVAFQLSHELLAGKLLVGCEYASDAAARWPG